jgi:hypothetical protein
VIVVSEQVEEIQVFVEVSNGVSAHKLDAASESSTHTQEVINNTRNLTFLTMKLKMKCKPVEGVLDEPFSAKPAQPSCHTGPPGYIGWTRFQPMVTGGPYVRLLR